MLTCVPLSFCTWDYRILGAAAPTALTFNFFSEQGTIFLGDAEFTIRKHGPMSGHWTLEHNDRTIADAQKPSPLFRSFELQIHDLSFTVAAQSAFTRCYEICAGAQQLGTIQPVHAFTRRAYIECVPEVPELAQLFAFWLAVITWRRAAQNNSS
jgi:hypothetical protein